MDESQGSPEDGWATAWLAAQIVLDTPSLLNAMRRSARQVCRHAGLLTAELGNFRSLEPDLERAVRRVEARTGVPVSDALFERLTERLGVDQVRPALERLSRAHPDA